MIHRMIEEHERAGKPTDMFTDILDKRKLEADKQHALAVIEKDQVLKTRLRERNERAAKQAATQDRMAG